MEHPHVYLAAVALVLAGAVLLHAVIAWTSRPDAAPDKRPSARFDSRRGRELRAFVAIVALASTPGCFSMQHTVGQGPTTGQSTSVTRWYALYGLVPVGDPIDSVQLAGDARDYRVTTEFTPLDVLLSSVTSFATFYRQTITVER